MSDQWGLVCAADVQPETVSWLWKQWMPSGKLVLLEGNPGCGKTAIAIDLVARLTTGRAMPDGEPMEPSSALYLSTEDGAADTIRPRLDAAEADVSRVHLLDWTSATTLQLPQGTEALEGHINDFGARLIVLDTLMSFVSGHYDSHRDQDVRRALFPLVQAAEATGVTVLALRHLNKASGMSAMNRGMGSIAFNALARSVWHAGKHPNNDGSMVLSPVKNNLSAMPKSRTYRIEERHNAPVVAWNGTCDLEADDLVVEQRAAPSALAEAEEWLKDALAEGQRPATEIEAAAAEAGISKATLRRAKKSLGVTAKRFENGWVWIQGAQGAQPQGLSMLSALDF